MNTKSLARGIVFVWTLCSAAAGGAADAHIAPAKGLAAALPREKWQAVQNSVDRALGWLASQQQPNGSFPTMDLGEPGVTSLCVMAFLSRGHRPGFGPYGEQLDRAIDFVLSCQKENGLLSLRDVSQTGSYNHAIAGLMLAEAYGHITGQRARNAKAAISKAIAFTRTLQTRLKVNPADLGGVRYLRMRSPDAPDSDLSVTVWHMMFLRSAKNAEFNVPPEYVNDIVEYVQRCWYPPYQMFNYIASDTDGRRASRSMVGAGIVALSLSGHHDTPMAKAAGEWLLQHPFNTFGAQYGPWDRYFYGAYYCSQAAAQLGGKYWEGFYPPLVDTFLKVQEPSGAFPPEPLQGDAMFGQSYTTAVAVLALTPAYQLLPVYQR